MEAIVSISTIRRPVLTLVLTPLVVGLSVQPVNGAFAGEVKKKSIQTSPIKRAGRTTTSVVVNTLLNGIGAPSSSLGSNGDFYIDTVGMNIYGPKKKNAWPIPKSLIGPPGLPGASGKPGSNGKDGRDGSNGKDGTNGKDGDRGPAGTSSVGAGEVGPAGPAGPSGPAGPTGPAGAQGSAGVAGPSGAAGAAGVQGETGPRGLQGLQGIQGETGPRGLQGIQGDVGATGAAGSNGAAGSAGAKGDTGAQGIQGIQGETGPAGPVRIFTGSVNFTGVLSGNGGTSKESNSFATLNPGKKYFLRAQVYATSENAANYYLAGTVNAFGAEVVPVTNFTIHNGNAYRSATQKIETVVSIFTTIDGGSLVGSNYSLKIQITCGESTNLANDQLSLAGFYILEEVSAIN